MTHYKEVCKCGKVLKQCRCPGKKEIRVADKCEHDWKQALVDELDEQYDIAANVVGRSVEIEMPSTRHVVDVVHSDLYGFITSLRVYDETGGVLTENTLETCVKRESLADDIASLYNSY